MRRAAKRMSVSHEDGAEACVPELWSDVAAAPLQFYSSTVAAMPGW